METRATGGGQESSSPLCIHTHKWSITVRIGFRTDDLHTSWGQFLLLMLKNKTHPHNEIVVSDIKAVYLCPHDKTWWSPSRHKDRLFHFHRQSSSTWVLLLSFILLLVEKEIRDILGWISSSVEAINFDLKPHRHESQETSPIYCMSVWVMRTKSLCTQQSTQTHTQRWSFWHSYHHADV